MELKKSYNPEENRRAVQEIQMPILKDASLANLNLAGPHQHTYN